MFKHLVLPALLALSCATSHSRIVEGEDADIEDYPYQLSLQYYGVLICGATIIDKKYAVTAAHCTDGISASSLKIRAGSDTHSWGGVLIQVVKIHQHPQYDIYSFDYDISVLELKIGLEFGERIQKIELPSINQHVATGSKANCTGWGEYNNSGGSEPNTLKSAVLQIIDPDECNNANYGGVTERMLCARGDNGSFCQRDSGGPLVINRELVGIVSWGYECNGRAQFPGVFSSVPSMRNFITEVSGI